MDHLLYLIFRCDGKFGFWGVFGASKHTLCIFSFRRPVRFTVASPSLRCSSPDTSMMKPTSVRMALAADVPGWAMPLDPSPSRRLRTDTAPSTPLHARARAITLALMLRLAARSLVLVRRLRHDASWRRDSNGVWATSPPP